MLACVCQPGDPSAFRKSPVPLGATPIKITVTRQPPKPGKIIRIYPPSTYNDCNLSKSIERLVNLDESEIRNDRDREQEVILIQGTKQLDESGKESKGFKSRKKLPEGVQLSLNELRDMACRQQTQIEAQHQLLAAKEQRLRYLKEQEARQQRVQAESERLRRLRERVEAQELKLRKLRTLRGQVDHQKQNNISLTSDLDSIRALFNEKEKELSLAVAKVEELTRQLEELRRGRTSNRDLPPPTSTLELDKLRRELMYRNKLNEQQNQRLNQQREALTARQDEMSAIDKRISELQERLYRKRTLNQQLASQISAASHKAAYQQLVRLTLNTEQNNQAFTKKQQPNVIHPPNGLLRGNIAAVEPYNHVPLQPNQQIRGINQNQKENTTYHQNYPNQQHIKADFIESNDIQEVNHITNKIANLYYPQKPEDPDNLKHFSNSKLDPKYQTLPYNTKFTVNLLTNTKTTSKNELDPVSDVKNSNNFVGSINTTSTKTNHMTVHSAPLNAVNKNLAIPLVQQNFHIKKSGDDKENQNHENQNEEIHRLNKLEQPPVNNSLVNNWTSPVSYQKPVSSVAPTSIHHVGVPSAVYQTSSIKVQPVEPQTISSKVFTPVTPLTYVGNNAPAQIQTPDTNTIQSPPNSTLSPPQSTSTPLSSSSEPQSPRPALPPKPAIKPPPRLSQVVAEEHTKPPPLPLSEPPEEKSPTLVAKANNVATAVAKQTLANIPSSSAEMIIKAKPLNIKKQALLEQPKLKSYGGYAKNGTSIIANRKVEIPAVFTFSEAAADKVDPSLQNGNEKEAVKDETDRSSRSSVEDSSDSCRETKDDVVIRRCKKGNLKQTGKANLSRRVSFDPLALLLDASLEGELELVKKTATQVTNPSAANDEGITALHNAICAGHFEIVKFLVEFGCDVNAQDSDGWTPLHCAASCNNLAMVKFLVEHGACIFATTLSDHETAAEKCEEDEEGFDGCSEYLYSVQEKLGILNGGLVYAVFDYSAQQPDELTFNAGQQFTVLRKGDENEREWWWSKFGDKEGYVPRNLLGLYPRVQRSEEAY